MTDGNNYSKTTLEEDMEAAEEYRLMKTHKKVADSVIRDVMRGLKK